MWFPPLRLGRLSRISTLMSLSGTAAESRQTGCFASGGNTEKLPREKPFTAFPLAVFLYFHCARKLAIFRPERSTRKLLVFIYRVISRGAGAGDEPSMTASGGNLIDGEISRNEQSRHEGELRRLRLRTSGPCRRARERAALEPFHLLAKSQLIKPEIPLPGLF